MKDLLKRIEALERQVPTALVIFAETESGETIEDKVKNVLSDTGELLEGFKGVGNYENNIIVADGGNLRDIDRVFRYFKLIAADSCEHNMDYIV